MPNNKVFNGAAIPLFTKITDGTQTLDISNGSAVTLDTNLYEIYIGNSYNVSALFQGVLIGSYADIRLITGSKATHIEAFVAAGGKANVYLYEGATYLTAGTALTIYNLNGNSTNTTVNQALRSPIVLLNGSLLYQTLLPAGKGTIVVGGKTSSTSQTILKNSTDYLYRVQNTSNIIGNISIEFNWYEI